MDTAKRLGLLGTAITLGVLLALAVVMMTSNTPVHATSSPDLEVGSPSVNDATLYTGNSFTLSVTVTNAGDVASEATTLRYYRSTDSTISTSDTAQGTESVGALAADGTSDHYGGLTAPSTAGTYYYGACVDSVTGESDTSDNCSTAVTVTVNARPDLVVDKPGQDMKVRPGATFTLSPKVRNIGDAESSATTLRYYSRYTGREEYGQVLNPPDVEVGTDAIGALAPGGESAQSIELTAPTTLGEYQGAYFYGACVDKVAGEPATTNNCSNGIEVRVQFRPDLTVSANARNTVVSPRQTFGFSVTITNEGHADANGYNSNIRYRFYQSTDATITESDTELDEFSLGRVFAPGSVTDDDQVVGDDYLRAPSEAGTYYYGACVDSVTDEWDTTNNCSNAVAVTVEVYPDLSMGFISITRTPPLGPGMSFRLSGRLENEGNGEAAATTMRFYRSTDAVITSSDTQLATAAVDALAAGGIKHYGSGDLIAPSTPGDYYYGACVDAVTDESDTNNNCTEASTMNVPASAPNLILLGTSVSDNSLAAGGSFTLSTTVLNSGNLEAAATTLHYYRSTDSTITTSDTEEGTDSVGAITGGSTSAQSIDLTAPSTAGTYYYGVCVDTVTNESNTTDNCQSSGTQVTVAPAPIISGTAQVGQTLTADTSDISDPDGLTNVSYSYQWLADDTEIDGATSSTYTVQASDNGKVIKVRVTFTDDANNEESLTSAGTSAVVLGGL